MRVVKPDAAVAGAVVAARVAIGRDGQRRGRDPEGGGIARRR